MLLPLLAGRKPPPSPVCLRRVSFRAFPFGSQELEESYPNVASVFQDSN